MKIQKLRSAHPLLVLVAGLLSGCGSDLSTRAPITGAGGGTGTTPTTGPAFVGIVKAAGKPVVGASVQVFAAGAAGPAKGAAALTAAPLTTDATGSFSVPAGFVCATPATQVYLIARGGRGDAAAAANSALAEMAVMGPCSGITSGSALTINEATTVAAVWALQQFMAVDGTIGASATNTVGLANAMLMARALVNGNTGAVPGTGFPASVTSPSSKINTLANLLSLCATDAASSVCASLLTAAAAAGKAAPADTLAAALAIARAPAANVPALYAAASSASSFSPALPSAPLDWMLVLTYAGGGLQTPEGPTALAIDATGNAWVANFGGVVSAFSPIGAPLFASGITGGGLNSSYGLAIDPIGNIWVANDSSDNAVNTGLGTVTEITAAGQFLSGATGFGNGSGSGGFSIPVALAIDPNRTVWVVNTQNGTVTQLNSSGQTISGSVGYGSSALAFPSPIAIDADHNAWIGNMNGNSIVKISADGKTVLPVTCCDGVQGLAIDAGGYVWAANYYGSSVSRITASGKVANGSPYVGPTLTYPSAVAIDGAGNVWVSNFREHRLTELAGSDTPTPGAVLSPAAGWASDAGLNQPLALAADASGNLWVSNFIAGTVTELIGVAAPVKTPLLGPVQQP